MRTRMWLRMRTCECVKKKYLCNNNTMNRSNILISKELDCSKNGLYKNTTLNGRTGYALTKANIHRRLGTVYNVARGLKRISPGIARLGGGTQGVVYLACTSPRCDHNIVIKVSPKDKTNRRQSAEVEFDIQKTVYKIVKNHVPVPYKLLECKNFAPIADFTNKNTKVYDYAHQFVMYSEYAHGGTLKEWIRKVEERLTDADMAKMVYQVLATLKRIYSRYPEFRHNDLHLGNVLVDDTGDFPRLMITDFGLSRLKARGSNPIVNDGSFERVGISSRTSIKYDMHYFLNSLGYEIRHMKHFQQTKEFIVRTIPKEYLGISTAYVKEYRLRADAPDSSLPTLDKVLRDPYFKGQKPTPLNEVGSPKIRIRGEERNSAASMARTALANMPGVVVTTTTSMTKPSAAEFLKMSPKSRAKFKTKSRAEALGESRSIITKNVVGTKGKVLERRRRVAAATNRKYMTFTKSKPPASLSPIFKTPSPRTVKLTELVRLPRTPRSLPLVQKKKGTVGRRPKSAPSRIRIVSKGKKPIVPRVPNRVSRTARKVLMGRGKPKPPPVVPTMSGPSRTVIGKAPSPPKGNLGNVRLRKILNAYAETNSHLTAPVLVQRLKRIGVATPRATSVVQAWKSDWTKSRRNVSLAMQKLKNKKNLTKLGFPNSVRKVAQRRINARLVQGANGRVRAGKRLLESKTKQELVNMARQYNVAIDPKKMTKEKIIRALFG